MYSHCIRDKLNNISYKIVKIYITLCNINYYKHNSKRVPVYTVNGVA